MKLEVRFTDRSGRAWSVWDWRVIAKRRARVWPGLPEATHRTFVAIDTGERRTCKFGPVEGALYVPEVLQMQLDRARADQSPGGSRAG